MRTLAAAFVAQALLAAAAAGAATGDASTTERSATAQAGREADLELGAIDPAPAGPLRSVIWFDDMEGGTSGWTHSDGTVLLPHFHVDTYLAYSGGHSWWCGTFGFGADGGYGNDWDDRLELPPLDISALASPVLSFAYRCDSEPAHDVAVVERKVGGEFLPFAPEYDGTVPWTDLGSAGQPLGGSDNPLEVRFRFVSDDAFSDEDGLWPTEGGAFMVDDIRVFDFVSGEVVFTDDAESGGLCSAGVPAPSGDYWHLVSRRCPAWSDPHCWWCGDDSDTSRTPALLRNSLTTPPVDLGDVEPGWACTLRFFLHAEVPVEDPGDFYKEEVSTDGGATWHTLGTWRGDFALCHGWAVHGTHGFAISEWLPGTTFLFRLTFYSDGDGCGPGKAGGAGIMLDDIWIEAVESPVERATWGALKALFR